MSHSEDWERDVLERAQGALEGTAVLDRELKAAYDQLFARHYRRVYTVCHYYTRSPEKAVELAQETMLTGHRKIADFRGDGRFGAWLCGIAKMMALNARRKKADVLTEDGLLETAGPEGGALSEMASGERSAMVRACIDQLPADDADFAHARWLDGMEVAEIEAIFGLPAGQGRVTQQRCKRKLTKLFSEWLEVNGHGLSFVRTANSWQGPR